MSVNYTGTGTDNEAGLVPEDQMIAQQQDAASQVEKPIAAHVAPEKPAKPVENNVFHELKISLLVSLDLTNGMFLGRKKSLSAVEIDDGDDGEAVNLYSPFRAAAKPKDNKPAALQGVVRGILGSILDTTDEVNTSRIKILGKESDVVHTLSKTIKTTRAKFESLLPLEPQRVVAQLMSETETSAEPENLTFGQVVRVGHWINSPKLSTADTVASHNAVISLTVNSGAVYDSQEKYKAIGQVESVLERMLESRDPSMSDTQILLAVMLDPADLAGPEFRELLDALLTEGQYELYTRNELNACDGASWLPTTKAEVARELLVPNGDLMLVKLVGGEEEVEAEAGEAGETTE